MPDLAASASKTAGMRHGAVADKLASGDHRLEPARLLPFATAQAGRTALVTAAAKGDVETARLLLDRGADMEAIDCVRSP